MPTAKLHPHVTGNAGLYYVCYRLSLLGWNVMPTARNARGVDVIAYNSTGKRFIGVQVKALSRRVAVPLGASVDNLMGDFWVVAINVATNPVAFVCGLPRSGRVRKGTKKMGRHHAGCRLGRTTGRRSAKCGTRLVGAILPRPFG